MGHPWFAKTIPRHQSSYSQMMIGVSNHQSIVFRSHYHSQKVCQYPWSMASTAPKINIEPENNDLEDDFPLPGARILRFQPLIFQVFSWDFGTNQSINQLQSLSTLRLFNRDNFAMTGTASAIALVAYFSMNVLFTGVQVGMCFCTDWKKAV